jgi:hypothetical protein
MCFLWGTDKPVNLGCVLSKTHCLFNDIFQLRKLSENRLTLEGRIFINDKHRWIFNIAVVAYYTLLIKRLRRDADLGLIFESDLPEFQAGTSNPEPAGQTKDSNPTQDAFPIVRSLLLELWYNNNNNCMALVHERTISTELSSLVGEVSVNFCG